VSIGLSLLIILGMCLAAAGTLKLSKKHDGMWLIIWILIIWWVSMSLADPIGTAAQFAWDQSMGRMARYLSSGSV
jgi:hypothetical protein